MNSLGGLLAGLFTAIVILTIISAVSIGFHFFGKKQIKSSYKIEPDIELTIKENKVDTIYVYKKRNSK